MPDFILNKKRKNIVDLQELVHLPISNEVFNQLETILDKIDSCNLNDENDTWAYIWGPLSKLAESL